MVDRFHVAKKFNEAIDGQRKKNHPGVQGEAVEGPAEGVPLADVGVPPATRKDLSEEDRQKLEGLFRKLPRLRTLYEIRVRFQEIFDTAQDRRKAQRALMELFLDMLEHFPELDAFIRTFEDWQEEILNYFDARQTSAAGGGDQQQGAGDREAGATG